MLCSRSADGTPMVVKERIQLGHWGSKKRSVITNSSKEFLVKNEFFRCKLPGGGHLVLS